MGIKAIYIGDNIDLIEKLTKETSIESLSVTTQTLNVVKSIENLDLVIYEVSTNRNDLMIVKNLKESIKKLENVYMYTAGLRGGLFTVERAIALVGADKLLFALFIISLSRRPLS